MSFEAAVDVFVLWSKEAALEKDCTKGPTSRLGDKRN
jgi:hypothetical protein